jgi:xanthine dehydrogenase accessory factor
MKEVVSDIDSWLGAGNQDIALATVIQTWGSAPRKVGSKMAMMAGGEISGSVSGGCVEGAVFDAGLVVLDTGFPQLLHFGVADETAWQVGLACGGIIEIFVERLNLDAYQFMRGLVNDDRAGAGVTIIRGPQTKLGEKLTLARDGGSVGSLGQALDGEAARAALEASHSQRVELSEDIELFIDAVRPSPALIMVGGVHIAIALTAMAKTLGYRTIVIDPRRAFGSEQRFTQVDRLIQAWPKKAFSQLALTAETAVAMLTHDPKIDDPAIAVALRSPAFYIGALGSNKTHAKRKKGLDIGAKTPEEIALSIMAEIVNARRSG